MSQKFSLGMLSITPAAMEDVPQDEVLAALRRHASGDWGQIDDEDRQENERSLKMGLRLLSVYTSSAGVRFWIITEADRSATTVLLPDDY